MRPSKLLPGDCLLYRAHDLLGNLIQWGQWLDGKEQSQYCHIALVADATRLGRQNPGGPAFEPLDSQPWDYIDVYRLNLTSMNPGVLPVYPGGDLAFQAALLAAMSDHWHEGYGYAEISALQWEDLEARIGLIADAEKQRTEANALLVQHQSICSVWGGQEVLPDAIKKTYNLQVFNPWPGIGPGQLRPSDWPKSVMMERILS